MTDVLNLALKKEIFEGLKNGVTNIIPIEKTNWWKKRLMDVDTGRFKPFKEVIASCGSADKFIYEIEKIELNDETFIITVINPKMNPKPINPEIINPEIITPVTETKEEDVVKFSEEVEGKKPYVAPEVIVEEVKNEVIEQMNELEPEPEPEPEPEEDSKPKKSFQEIISDLLNNFCSMKNVFVVNMPRVTIRNNGQILGCNKRLLADRENDVLFEFKKKEFFKHPETPDSRFVISFMTYLVNLSNNNYVFINRKACNFKEDEYGNIILTIYVTTKKKYLFKQK